MNWKECGGKHLWLLSSYWPTRTEETRKISG